MNWQYSQINSHIQTLWMDYECICAAIKFGLAAMQTAPLVQYCIILFNLQSHVTGLPVIVTKVTRPLDGHMDLEVVIEFFFSHKRPISVSTISNATHSTAKMLKYPGSLAMGMWCSG
jgi:hypothetical protein